MSKIVGNYVNSILNAKLSIATANDSNGAITGSLSVGTTNIPFTGVWNASTVAPNGLFSFTGSIPLTAMGGSAQTDDFNQFASISLGFSISQKGTNTLNVAGKFTRV